MDSQFLTLPKLGDLVWLLANSIHNPQEFGSYAYIVLDVIPLHTKLQINS